MARENKILAANAALWNLVNTLFTAHSPVRNPGGFNKPKTAGPADYVGYVAMIDDKDAEVLGALMNGAGSVFDLVVAPAVVFTSTAQTKEVREGLAWPMVSDLADAIAQDRTLGGAVSFAELETPEGVEATGPADWMAGGLQVRVRILFDAPTKAG